MPQVSECTSVPSGHVDQLAHVEQVKRLEYYFIMWRPTVTQIHHVHCIRDVQHDHPRVVVGGSLLLGIFAPALVEFLFQTQEFEGKHWDEHVKSNPDFSTIVVPSPWYKLKTPDASVNVIRKRSRVVVQAFQFDLRWGLTGDAKGRPFKRYTHCPPGNQAVLAVVVLVSRVDGFRLWIA